MKTHIQKWGNTLVVRLPEPIIEEIHWDQGTPINISVVEDRLVIDGLIEEEWMTLEDLLAGITAENCHHKIDTGIPIGNEVW